MATATGRRIVDMVWEDQKPSTILSAEAFDDAITVDMAIGGSTNAIVHLLALARRAGVDLRLDRFDELSRRTPVIANIRPAGKTYLMEDFYDAGGLKSLMWQLRGLLNLDRPTVSGRSLGENIADCEPIDADIIRSVEQPLSTEGGTYVLRGNLAPHGCVIKPVAADPRLHHHIGPAVVFDDYPDLKARLNDPATEITADSVLILRNAGPHGAPGFPEWGMLPIPTRLLKQGVRDMVRISDARMSGTSYGTCILHVSPESCVGGPLAFVQEGDLIELNVAARTLDLRVSEEELARRRAQWQPPKPHYERGYGQLFLKHVTQAHEGCDFDFLERGAETPEPPIH